MQPRQYFRALIFILSLSAIGITTNDAHVGSIENSIKIKKAQHIDTLKLEEVVQYGDRVRFDYYDRGLIPFYILVKDELLDSYKRPQQLR